MRQRPDKKSNDIGLCRPDPTIGDRSDIALMLRNVPGEKDERRVKLTIERLHHATRNTMTTKLKTLTLVQRE